jgi:hypothetical protein
MTGRINETSLMMGYQLKTREFLSKGKMKELLDLGVQMYRKGKLKLPAMKSHSGGAVRRIFAKVLARERADRG